jgi:hypothetical protein
LQYQADPGTAGQGVPGVNLLRLPHIKELHSNTSMSKIKCTTELPLAYCG